MAEYGQNNVFNLLEVEPSLEDQVDEKPAGKEKKNVKKENKAPSKKAPASEAPVAAAPAAKAPRKRDHDRHVSGTGRGKETQKGGAGKHNWGDKDTTPETAAVDATEAHTDAPAADDAAAEEDKQPTLGLDDYFKQLQAKRPEEDNQQNVREVVEDDSFKVIRSLDKDEDDDILFGDVMIRKELKKKGGAGGKKKASVSLDEFVKEHGGLQRERDFDRSRGDRGGRGRGGFRGGRGRGGFGSPAGLAPVGGDAAVDAAAAPVAAPVAGDAAPAAVAAPAAASPAAGAGAGAAPAAGAERGGFRGRGRGGRGRGGDFERGRGRGGRGGGDFRGGRGGPRGGHPGSGPRRDVNANQASIDIANDESFPALGAAPRK